MIQGLVYGERLDYKNEDDCYDQAKNITDQIARLSYYRGVSFSQRAYNSFDWGDKTLKAIKDGKFILGKPGNWKNYFREGSKMTDLKEIKEYIDNAKEFFREAVKLAPYAAWHRYYLGCELLMWEKSDDEEREGKKHLIESSEYLDIISEELDSNYYLERYRDEPWYKKILEPAKSESGKAR